MLRCGSGTHGCVIDCHCALVAEKFEATGAAAVMQGIVVVLLLKMVKDVCMLLKMVKDVCMSSGPRA